MSDQTSSLSDRFAPQVQPAGSAIARNAQPSSDYVIKLAEAKAVLSQAAAQYAGVDGGASNVTQASSLGAEDVVISHLINSLQLDIGIFVLETGALHKETLDLLARFKATSRAPVTVYQPVTESVVQFVAREGKDAMYRSIELRKACCGIPQDGAAGASTQGQGCLGDRPAPRAERRPRRCAAGGHLRKTHQDQSPGQLDLGRRLHCIRENRLDYNPCMTSFSPASAASLAPARSASVKTSALAAGGGEQESAKECGLHVQHA